MPKEKAPRKQSDKQDNIMRVFNAATEPLTPSKVGEACGKAKGSEAADWAYPAIKNLVGKGILTKTGPGLYAVVKEA